jgi:hypothetical protein
MLTGGDKPSFGGEGVPDNAAAKVLQNPRLERFDSDILVRGFIRSPDA